MGVPAAAVIPAVGGLLSGIMGSNDQQRENAHNEKMWHLNNAYNTPKAQMQRFKDAGLNPNLIYGKGTSGNSNSPSKVATNTSTQTAIKGLSASAQALLQGQQQRTSEQQEQLLDAQTDNQRAQAVKSWVDAGFSQQDAENRVAQGRANVNKTVTETRNLDSKNQLTEKQIAIAQKQFEGKSIENQVAKFRQKQLKLGIEPNTDMFYKLLPDNLSKNQMLAVKMSIEAGKILTNIVALPRAVVNSLSALFKKKSKRNTISKINKETLEMYD